MAVESGKDGLIKIGSTAIPDILGWTFDKTANGDQFGSSSGAGYAKAVVGTKRGSGTITAKWDASAASTIAEGVSATLLLYLNATEFYSVPAIITSFSLNVDIDTGNANSFTANFLTNGAWTEPTLS